MTHGLVCCKPDSKLQRCPSQKMHVTGLCVTTKYKIIHYGELPGLALDPRQWELLVCVTDNKQRLGWPVCVRRPKPMANAANYSKDGFAFGLSASLETLCLSKTLASKLSTGLSYLPKPPSLLPNRVSKKTHTHTNLTHIFSYLLAPTAYVQIATQYIKVIALFFAA